MAECARFFRIAVLTAVVSSVATAILGVGAIASAQDSATTPAVASAPDTTVHVSGLRSPVIAVVSGIVLPGAGLAYAGQWGRAVGTYFGTIGLTAIGTGLIFIDRCTFTFADAGRCNPGRVWPAQTLGVVAVGAGLFWWGYAAVDAGRIVRRDNADRLAGAARSTFGSVIPTMSPPDASGAPWHAGLRVAW